MNGPFYLMIYLTLLIQFDHIGSNRNITKYYQSISCPILQKKGWDISHWNNNGVPIDWAQIPILTTLDHYFAFIIAKATEGGTVNDTQFVYNWAGMKTIGCPLGAYHFFTTTATPKAQVANIVRVLSLVGFNPNTDIFAIDFEITGRDVGLRPEPERLSPDEMADRLNELLILVENELHVSPLIYTNNDSWKNYINYKKYNFGRYRLWLADTRIPSKRQIPSGWNSVYILQYVQDGSFIPNLVKGNNDFNCYPNIKRVMKNTQRSSWLKAKRLTNLKNVV